MLWRRSSFNGSSRWCPSSCSVGRVASRLTWQTTSARSDLRTQERARLAFYAFLGSRSMSHRDASDALTAENFDLRCRNESLSARISELCGGTSGAALHEDLMTARQQLVSKETELNELNELFCSIERETAEVRAELDASRERATVAEAAAAKAHALEAAVEDAARKRVVAVDSLAREAFGVQLLASSLAEAEERAERAVREKSELLASTLVNRDATEQALARNARGRDELSEELRKAQAEAARQQGAVGALETRVSDLTAELSSARAHADSADERALASEVTVGGLRVELAASQEAQQRATSDAAKASATAEEARAETAARAAELAERLREIEDLRAEMAASREEAAAAEAAAAAKIGALEAAAKRTAETAEEQRAAADAVGGDLRSALDTANLASAAARQEADVLRHECEMMRQALTAAQTQASVELSRETARANADIAATRAERDEHVAVLQRQVDEHSTARYTSESRCKAALDEARRLGKCEKQLASLKEECKGLQAEVQKKTEMLDRLLKRKGGSIGGAAPTGTALTASVSAASLPPPLPLLQAPAAAPAAPPASLTLAAAAAAPPLLDATDDSFGPLKAYALPPTAPTDPPSSRSSAKSAATSARPIVPYSDAPAESSSSVVASAAAASASTAAVASLPSLEGGAAKENALASNVCHAGGMASGKVSKGGGMANGGMAKGMHSGGGLSARGNARPPSPRPGECGPQSARLAPSSSSTALRDGSSGPRRAVQVQSRYLSPSVRK